MEKALKFRKSYGRMTCAFRKKAYEKALAGFFRV